MTEADNDAFYGSAERRVEYFTLGLGLAATLVTAAAWGRSYGVGVAVGCVLSWVNYRWLKQGLEALGRFAREQQAEEKEKIRIPKRVYVKFFGRYALILGVAYVIFARSLLPVVAVVAGLFALAAAVILEILYELARGTESPRMPG